MSTCRSSFPCAFFPSPLSLILRPLSPFAFLLFKWSFSLVISFSRCPSCLFTLSFSPFFFPFHFPLRTMPMRPTRTRWRSATTRKRERMEKSDQTMERLVFLSFVERFLPPHPSAPYVFVRRGREHTWTLIHSISCRIQEVGRRNRRRKFSPSLPVSLPLCPQ